MTDRTKQMIDIVVIVGKIIDEAPNGDPDLDNLWKIFDAAKDIANRQT